MEQSYRLIFAYEGDKLVVRSVQRIAMRAIASEPIEERTPRTGRFVELRTMGGKPVYRRHISGFVPKTVEYPTGDPVRPFGRTTPPGSAVFSVVVPAHAEARTAALMDVEGESGPSRKAEATAAPAPRDLLVVDLPAREEEAGQ
jgi:hypothetical protein